MTKEQFRAAVEEEIQRFGFIITSCNACNTKGTCEECLKPFAQRIIALTIDAMVGEGGVRIRSFALLSGKNEAPKFEGYYARIGDEKYLAEELKAAIKN